jgi:hypothetical protein
MPRSNGVNLYVCYMTRIDVERLRNLALHDGGSEWPGTKVIEPALNGLPIGCGNRVGSIFFNVHFDLCLLFGFPVCV